MAYITDPSNPGWLLKEGADAALESSWVQIPEGFEPDPSGNNPGWYLRVGGDGGNPADWWEPDAPRHPGGTTFAGLVTGIDVSNAQPKDLTALIAKVGAQHVVVKLYQTIEVRGGRDHAKAQIASAQANGCSVGGYVWLYSSISPTQQVNDALSLAAEAGIVLPVLWIDVEAYTDGTCPSAAQVREALDAARAAGQRVGIYTGLYVWRDKLGSAGFNDELLWSANYNGVPDLASTPAYGGMTVVAHQYNDVAPDRSPLDVDVFDASVCA